MGRNIAHVNLARGLTVVLTDALAEALQRADSALDQELTAEQRSRLTVTSELTQLASCDLVLEAIVESLKPKKQLFARLEEIVRPDALLATNTSTLSITRLAEGLARPERFCGLHFCHPVRERPLVEVVPGCQTTATVTVAARDYASALGMDSIVVRDAPGFVVNRVLHPYFNEALVLLGEGADVRAIDAAATAFGMPWGPFTQMDEIGIDVVLRGGQALARAFPDRTTAHDLLVDLYSAGRLGKKSGAGFYRYSEGATSQVDEQMSEFIERRRRGPAQSFPTPTLQLRLFGRMAQETQQLVAEGVVGNPGEVQRALVKGLGFPSAHVEMLAGGPAYRASDAA